MSGLVPAVARAFALRHVLAVLVVSLSVVACATAPLAPRDRHPFDLLGRVFVTYSGGAVTSNVRWEHAPDRDEIWLMTPTGQTLAHVVDTAAGATLTRADQQQFRASSVEALTRRALGWTLPLSPLQYWVRGMPAPGSTPEAPERDKQNRLLSFNQNGWRVSLIYHEAGELAGKVRRVDLKDGANEIRFVVDNWRDAAGN
jgi:outer membrane lipoprotein LolB